MREHLAREVLRQLVEQLGQQHHRSASAVPWASTNSTAWPTVRICAACSSDIAHAVGVLELLHERVEVERVGLQVLLEAGARRDRLRVDVQLVGEVGADQLEDLLGVSALIARRGQRRSRGSVRLRARRARSLEGASHPVPRQASVRRGQRRALERARLRRARAWVCPTMSCARAALGAQDRLGEALAA